MLADFGAAVGAGGRLPAPLFWRVQMWGAALPTTALEGKPSCVWDPAGRVGICGDWLSGASMQCAWDRRAWVAGWLPRCQRGTCDSYHNTQCAFATK